MKLTILSTIIRRVVFGLSVLFAFSATGLAQSKKKVEILHSDLLDFDQRIIANAQRLLGNVQIRVDGALMWCDSLYSYNDNTVDAFGNVHIVRGDTLDMYADFINYNGNTKLAKARRNVRLIDKKMTLTTDSLDYAMVTDMASYNYSGTLRDSTNVLTSVIGQYYVNEKKAYFRKNVDGTTKDYKIKSDTLIYYTNTKKVYIEGPTHIFNENDTLYAEYGWYDSMKNFANLTKKPRIWNEKQNVKADSIFYDKEKGEGLALGHAHVQDIENKIIVEGNRIEYNDISKTALAIDSAMLIMYSEKDTLFLHAQVLRTIPDTTKIRKVVPAKKNQKLSATKLLPIDTAKISLPEIESIVPDSLPVDTLAVVASDSIPAMKDTISVVRDSIQVVKDTIPAKETKDPRLVLAYNKVRFFRNDMQGKCDSLVYWSKDSTIQMYTEPVVWSNKNQLSASYIEMINRTKGPNEVKMNENAFIISMEDDSIRFNQIKGKNMVGFIRNNELYRINVNGNGQSNYYARDKDGIIGLNKAESSNIVIYLNKGKVKSISFIQSPEGELKPMESIEEGDKLLPGFIWMEDIRPKSKADIFREPVISAPATETKKEPEKAIE